MPSEPVDLDPFAALGAALAPVAEVARQGSEDVLDLLPVAGDRETQVALDAYLEQVADLLREVQVCADELTGTLRVAGGSQRGRGAVRRDAQERVR